MSRFLDDDSARPTGSRFASESEDLTAHLMGTNEQDYDDEYFDGQDEPMPPSVRRRGSWLKNLLAIGLSLAVLLGGGYFVVTRLLDGYISFTTVPDYPGPGEVDVLVEIPEGATLTDIANVLVDHDVVQSRKAFLNAAQDTPGAAAIQPGSYRLKTKMSAKDAVAALINLDNLVRNQVTIPEGLRNSQVLQRLNEATGIPLADLEAALADTANLNLPDWANGATEGFLFPETYAFDPNSTAQALLSQMPAHFTQVTNSIGFVASAQALGLSPFDAVTVASIIERETRDPAYGPDIAQVIYNRLRIDMRLQMDSTVHFAANSYGNVTTTDEERASQSPYNTYVHTGLPPGAISNPGQNSLNSAVHPTEGTYLFFVTVNPDSGETKFASDEAGHQANVAEFQAWCRANSDRCG